MNLSNVPRTLHLVASGKTEVHSVTVRPEPEPYLSQNSPLRYHDKTKRDQNRKSIICKENYKYIIQISHFQQNPKL